jgi:predicted  nucleic acid-binding Zn-ribbon protein
MSHRAVTGSCDSCESSFTISFEEAFVSEDDPEFCPFCGEVIEELTEEYIEDEDSEDDDDKWD